MTHSALSAISKCLFRIAKVPILHVKKAYFAIPSWHFGWREAARRAALLLICLMASNLAQGKKLDKALLNRIFHYPEIWNDSLPDSIRSNSYTKVLLQVPRRNMLLMCVPSLFYLARDRQRTFFTESYGTTIVRRDGRVDSQYNIWLSTIYHRHRTLPNLTPYLFPHLYRPTLFNDHILSPFYAANHKFYSYKLEEDFNGNPVLAFHSKLINTQLIRRGKAHIDLATGRLIDLWMEGEYDMAHFRIDVTMGTEGIRSLIPASCRIQVKISVTGNIILCDVLSKYGLPQSLPDTLRDADNRAAMDSVRPVKLTVLERQTISRYDSAHAANNTSDSLPVVKKRKKSVVKHVLWDIIGSNMVNKINTSFDEKRGTLRFGPIFNPLFFGYSKQKGVVYRTDIRGSYIFNGNSDLSLRMRAGYSFKQRQFFFNLPLQYSFNKARNGFVRIELSNGNRITNSQLLDKIKDVKIDTVKWNELGLDYFKDMRFDCSFNYDVIKSFLGLRAGFTSHRRSAVDQKGFKLLGKDPTYTSFAPYLRLQIRPLTDRVPLVVTAEYEQGLKTLGGEISYGRLEIDGQYRLSMSCMRSLQLRSGFGCYTQRGDNDYFLDYDNFRENYLQGGWNDDWSGEFELLNSNWYNASNYYFRSNATYESPLLFLSWVPKVGQVVEKERIYFSTLTVKGLYPYIEAGYSFTTRLLSMGIFTATSPHKFEGVGIKMGFELFNNW